MKTKRNYTQKQIEEAIVHWSKALLNENMATEDELREMLGEGFFKKAIGSIKRGVENVKGAVKAVKEAPKNLFNKLFVPNDGVKKMIAAINKMSASAAKIKGTKIYATLGEKTLPVIGFAMANHKKTLLLLVDPDDSSAKPKTLEDIRKFILEEQKIKHPDEAIDAIKCAGATKEVIFESKLTDYISSKNLSKEDALKPENLKELKKLSKQNDEKTKAAVEKYFASKDGSTDGTSKKDDAKKTSSKKSSVGKKSKQKKDAEETKADEPSEEPSKKDAEETKADATEQSKAEKKNAITVHDNKLLDVKAEGGNIDFIFSKTKAEIKLDKKYADAFKV